MLSHRTGQTTVRLIRACASVQRPGRNRFWLGLSLVVTLAAGAGVALARWGNGVERRDSRRLLDSAIIATTTRLAHFIAAATPRARFDVASTSVTTVPAASFEAVPVATDSI